MWYRNYSQTFSRKAKLSIFLDQRSKFNTVCFCCMLNWELSKSIETKLQTTCFNSYKGFFKNKKGGLELVSLSHFLLEFLRKRRLELVSLPHFLLEFLRKIFLLLYVITRPNSRYYQSRENHWRIALRDWFL